MTWISLYRIGFITLILTIIPAKIFLAGDKSSEDISWGFLIIGLFGGLALFLYGTEKMSEGLKKSTGNQMRSILANLTKNRVKHLERLRHQRRESLETHSVHLELMDLMKQITVYSSNISETFIATFGPTPSPHRFDPLIVLDRSHEPERGV